MGSTITRKHNLGIPGLRNGAWQPGMSICRRDETHTRSQEMTEPLGPFAGSADVPAATRPRRRLRHQKRLFCGNADILPWCRGAPPGSHRGQSGPGQRPRRTARAAKSPDGTCRSLGMQEHWPGGRRQAAGGSCILWTPPPSPYAAGRREGGWVAWRTVPTFVAGVLATLAVAPLVRFRGPARADSAVTDRVVRWWAAVWLRAAGARVVVDGLEHVESAATYVVVSNHQSNLDPMAQLRALPLSLRVLAMRELFQIPLLGRAMCTAGMIEVNRDSPDFGQIDDAAPGPWRQGTRCWSIRTVRPHRMARSVTSKTAPSSLRSPARYRSCRLPCMAPWLRSKSPGRLLTFHRPSPSSLAEAMKTPSIYRHMQWSLILVDMG